MWISRKKWSELENTLQSIDSTLKRIEIIHLEFQKNRNPLKAAQDGVEGAFLRKQHISQESHLRIQDH